MPEETPDQMMTRKLKIARALHESQRDGMKACSDYLNQMFVEITDQQPQKLSDDMLAGFGLAAFKLYEQFEMIDWEARIAASELLILSKQD